VRIQASIREERAERLLFVSEIIILAGLDGAGAKEESQASALSFWHYFRAADGRVMVTLIGRGFPAVLDRHLRAPLDAGQTLLAAMLPYRLACRQFNISGWADLGTDAAGIAFVIHPKTLVHSFKVWE
jgi:hypothetical protein